MTSAPYLYAWNLSLKSRIIKLHGQAQVAGYTAGRQNHRSHNVIFISQHSRIDRYVILLAEGIKQRVSSRR